MSTDANNSSKKFEEALQLLNEAAREKKDEIGRLLSDKYSHIRDVVQDAAERNRETFRRVKKQAERVWEDNSEKVREFAEDVDEQVHKNPWPYIGGAALAALLLGFILGNSRQK
jgi:ElaB/YqjD/DUF883 family membrane-anchored ribosome-binding protein